MKLIYFAWVREKAGRSNEEVPLPDGVTTVQGLIGWLKDRDDKMAEAFGDISVIRVAVNQEHVGLDHTLGEDDEIAFFPPVTGG